MKDINLYKAILINFLLTIVIGVVLTACSKATVEESTVEEEHHEEEGIVELTKSQYETAGIVLGTVDKKQLSGTLKVNGLLDVPPQNQVSISVPYGGILKHTELLQGMWVSKGQVLAKMEHPDYIQMQQDYLEAASQLSFLEKEYNRQEELNKENVTATKTFEKITSEFNSIKSRVEGLRQKLSLLNINSDNLHTTGILRSIPLISPIGGYVTEVNANIGKFVQANDVVFEIVDTRHLHVELMVFEKDIPKIKEGQKVRFMLANESQEREAQVHLIGREIGAERTIRVHCHLAKEDKNLLPGMYLRASIESGTSMVNALPDEAIVNAEGKNYIFIQIPSNDYHHDDDHAADERAEANGSDKEEASFRFEMVAIKTGVSDNGYTEVIFSDEFDEGTKAIVLKGAYDLLSKMNNNEEAGHAH